MKLKHWQGYGTIEAKKISQGNISQDEYEEKYAGRNCAGYTQYRYPNSYNSNLKKLVIEVRGNHEYGIETDDKYHLYNWLVTKFNKNVRDDRGILGYVYTSGIEDNIDVCIYEIIIEED